VARYSPRLVAFWPAYATHFCRTGRRVLFVLEPTPEAVGGRHPPERPRVLATDPIPLPEGSSVVPIP
jgi:hypothetical protein